MSKRTRTVFKTVFAAFVMQALGSGSVLAFSDSFETPPEQDPKTVLGERASGAGYSVLTPVRSDGYLRIYELKTDAGTEHLVGDGLLQFRLRELAALQALRSLEKDESFINGLKQAVKRPAEFVESTVTDPLGTAHSTVSGVGKIIGRISKGVEQAVTGETLSPTELAGIVTGLDRARRELALKIGVDPYTTYQPLSEQLDRAAAASTSDELNVSAVMSLLPGEMAKAGAGTVEPLRTLIVDSTRSELEKYTADTLRRTDVAKPVIEAFAVNLNYTPFDRAVIAYYLEAMTSVDGREVLAASAADAKTRDEAYLVLRRIVLLEHYHRTVAGLARIREMADFLVAIRRDGVAALVLPLDMLSWTRSTAMAFSGFQEGLTRLPFPPTGVDFRITGDITPDTAERLASFGWSVIANWPMPEGPIY